MWTVARGFALKEAVSLATVVFASAVTKQTIAASFTDPPGTKTVLYAMQ